MNKHFIKRLAFFMVTVMLAQSGITVLASNETELSSDSYKLIANWDFEKTSADENGLLDKIGGSPLTMAGETSVDNGIVTVPGDTASYLCSQGNNGTEEEHALFYDLANKTIVMKAKLIVEDGEEISNGASLIHRQRAEAGLYFDLNNEDLNTTDIALNEWRVFAISIAPANGVAIQKLYVSKNDSPTTASDFIELSSKNVPLKYVNNTADKNDKVYFGKRNDFANSSFEPITHDTCFDYIKVYDGVLDAEQIFNELHVDYELAAHWDFENGLNDKLTGSALVAGGNTAVADGCVKVPKEKGSYLQAQGSSVKNENGVWYNLGNKTIVMRAKVEAEEDAELGGQDSLFHRQNSNITYTLNTEKHNTQSIPLNKWRVFVISITAGAGNFKQTLYVSTKEQPMSEEDFIELSVSAFEEGGQYVSNTGTSEYRVSFGKLYNYRNFDGPVCDTYYDDIKVYDAVLTLGQIAKENAVKISDGDGINRPALIGAQLRHNGDSFDVRFVATVDSLDYKKLGYKINLERWTGTESDKQDTEDGFAEVTTNFVYKALNYEDRNGRTQCVYADEDSYFVAIAVEGIKLTDRTDYLVGTVTPFAIDEDGNELYGDTYTITVVDGTTCQFTPYN